MEGTADTDATVTSIVTKPAKMTVATTLASVHFNSIRLVHAYVFFGLEQSLCASRLRAASHY